VRRINPHLVPLRAFVATVTTKDGRTFTTTAHGRTPDDAERQAEAEHDAARAVVRSEMVTR
jgi:hypothetical protein